MTPRAILFDLDNTAYKYKFCHAVGLDSSQEIAAELRAEWREFQQFGIDYEAARAAVKRRIAGTAAEHCRLLYFKAMTECAYGRTSPVATVALHDAYWAGFLSTMLPTRGCVELLRELRTSGIRTAWVTNFTTARQLDKLWQLGLAGAADFLVTSEEVGADKPDPRVVFRALELLNVAPAEAWLVGDSVFEDGGAAAAAGVRFVHLAHPFGWPELRALVYA